MDEAAKLKPMELELKRLEELTDSIVSDFVDMQKREEALRNTNGKVFFFITRDGLTRIER